MRLTELQPQWIHPNIFTFLCPHCRKVWLTCKNVEMRTREQNSIFAQAFDENHRQVVVGCKPPMAWNISGTDFQTLTVTPSIDASESGHWHGHITSGEIR